MARTNVKGKQEVMSITLTRMHLFLNGIKVSNVPAVRLYLHSLCFLPGWSPYVHAMSSDDDRTGFWVIQHDRRQGTLNKQEQITRYSVAGTYMYTYSIIRLP